MKLDGLKKNPISPPLSAPAYRPSGAARHAQAGIKREGVFDFLRIKARLA